MSLCKTACRLLAFVIVSLEGFSQDLIAYQFKQDLRERQTSKCQAENKVRVQSFRFGLLATVYCNVVAVHFLNGTKKASKGSKAC